MRIGFIGLGNMGLPIARNLLKAGHELTVYNRSRSKAEALASAGAQVANSVNEAGRAEVVVSMLADDPAVEHTALEDGGLVDSLPRGGIHLSLSTISVALSRRLTAAHAARGQSFIASPVFGRPDAAEAARLVAVVAGPAEATERVHPLLEAITRKVFVIGSEPYSANVVKLAGNFLIAAVLETLSEAFTLARKSGVEPAKFLEILNGSFFQSPIYENYGKIIIGEKFSPPGFALRLGLKDVRLTLAAAEEAAVPMPVASVIRDHFVSGVARGWADVDWAALAKVVAEDAGLHAL
jgi:3-hydroxyisobutyrate dehydrogenase-like beta-hydroxyacid dehydrogenase